MHVNKLIFSLLRKIGMYVYEMNQPDLTPHIYTRHTSANKCNIIKIIVGKLQTLTFLYVFPFLSYWCI